jgi:hypothetical protein
MSCTIVSCYYQLNQSKHTHDEYDIWIKNLLLNLVGTNIIIFVGQKEKEYIQQITQQNATIKCLLIIKELEDLPLSKKYGADFWRWQENIDPQLLKIGRGQDCYKLWNSKFHFLKEAINLNPFGSDKFIWNDIGNVRDPAIINHCLLKSYPNELAISSDKLDIVLLRGFNDPAQLFFQHEVHFSGSMFGGKKEILLEMCDLFYLYFDIYVGKKLFIGCDQQILATVFLKNPDKFNCILPVKSNDIDVWFYLYKFYTL